jgi:hypothetical protein
LSLADREGDGTAVNCVAWGSNSLLLSGAIEEAGDRLKLYEFSGTDLKLLSNIGIVSDAVIIHAVDWYNTNPLLLNGVMLVARGSDVFEAYFFDEVNDKFYLLSRVETAENINAIRTARYYPLAASGGANGSLNIYGYSILEFFFDTVNFNLFEDLHFTVSSTFQGECQINGNGHSLYLDNNSKFYIASDSVLKFEHLDIYGIGPKGISCIDDSGRIEFVNCNIYLDTDYYFDQGSMNLSGDNFLSSISGAGKFVYGSSKTSTVAANSIVYLDKSFTYSYAPCIQNRDLFYFEDETSVVSIENAHFFVSDVGISLNTGKLRIVGDCSITGQNIATEFDLGTGVDSSGDSKMLIEHGASLHFVRGIINYKNRSTSSLDMEDRSKMIVGSGVTMNVYYDIDSGDGVLVIRDGVKINSALMAHVYGKISVEGYAHNNIII